jgi:hypothetical protein
MNDIVLDAEIVRDYLSGRLSDSATREFEGRIARDPALVRTLEELLKFREGLEVLRERGELALLLRARRRWRRWALPLAAAAAVAAVAFVLALPFMSRHPVVGGSIAELRLPASAPHGIVAQYSFAAVRQAGAAPALELPPAGVLEVRVLATGTEADLFRVVLTRRDGAGAVREIGTTAGVRRDDNGFVTVYVDAARLEPGDYAVSAGPQPSAPGSEIPFRLRRAPSGAASSR